MHSDDLRRRRRALKLTQVGLGERFGVTSRTVIAWEGGEYAIPGWVTLALCWLEYEHRELGLCEGS